MPKFVCVEALQEEGKPHVSCLVTDRDGRYVGVQPRQDQPERVKLQHYSRDQAVVVSLVERFAPRKQVRRLSLEVSRAMKRGMLKVHPPKGPEENAKPWVVADNMLDAMKAFGLYTQPPEPKTGEGSTNKPNSGQEK